MVKKLEGRKLFIKALGFLTYLEALLENIGHVPVNPSVKCGQLTQLSSNANKDAEAIDSQHTLV